MDWIFTDLPVYNKTMVFPLSQALGGLVEIAAIAIAMYIIMKTGKKWLFMSTFFACSVACFCAALFEGFEDMLWVKITFVMIGKTLIVAFCVLCV